MIDAIPALVAFGPFMIYGAMDPRKLGVRRMIGGFVGTLMLVVALLYIWRCLADMQSDISRLQALIPKK
jgi:hypothetical protein